MSFDMKTVALTLAAALAVTPLAHAQTASTAAQTVDAMNGLWGKHPGYRANHAKGVVVEGSFVPTTIAAGLSKASIFAAPSTPVTVRFSDATGVPTLADGDPTANPHGMAIKFHPAAGGTVDLVTNSLGIFPVATGEDFLALLKAGAASGPDVPKPTPLDQFVASHPAVAKAGATVSTPSSFGREVYNGIDAFIFVNAAGKRQAFRWQIVPVDGPDHLSDDAAAKLATDFLADELPQRLQKGPVAFHLLAQLAEPADQTKDPTQAWPAERTLADMGTITLTKAVPDNEAAQKALRYLPNNLQPGIEVSDDPLIDARVRSYLISFGRRAS